MKKKFIRFAVWYRVLKALILTFSGLNLNILNSEESIDLLLNEHLSIIRLGDGEFGLYIKKDIHYQKWSEELLNEIDKIILDYIEGKSRDYNFMLAIPHRFFNENGLFLVKKRAYVSCWSESRLIFKKLIGNNNDAKYCDSFLFSRNNSPYYEKLFDTRRNAIFVHHDERYSKVFESKFNRITYFVKCSASNSFEIIDELCYKIEELIKRYRLEKSNLDIVISSGPAGKVIAYRFIQLGYRCIDSGHCWDNPLEI